MLMCYPEYVVPTMLGLCLSGNRWAKVWNFNNCPLHQVIECHIHDRTWRWNTSPGTRLDLLWTFLAYPRCVCQTIPGMATEPFALLASRTSACRGLAAGHMIHCSMLQWRAPIGHSFSMFFLDHRREISIQFQIFQDMDVGHPLHWIHHRW